LGHPIPVFVPLLLLLLLLLVVVVAVVTMVPKLLSSLTLVLFLEPRLRPTLH